MPRHRAKPRSFHAGLKFPVGRVHRKMKKGPYAKRLANGVPVYMTAVLEHITGELLKIIGEITQAEGMKRLSAFHIRTAARENDELRKLFSGVSLAEVCVLPDLESDVEQSSEGSGGESDSDEESTEGSASGSQEGGAAAAAAGAQQ
ncbi:hypothetical protein niasHS_016866 [Heterodera schachtii]|uniref:Histone H2A n=1 Tax=Heterodera schachtii TaxID=97005 RepID=A0ABD2HXB9_HETSC